MPSPEKSPLARLVLFIVCLAIAGSIVAGMHYFVIDLPEQNSLQAPLNYSNSCTLRCDIYNNIPCHGNKACEDNSKNMYSSCIQDCQN